MQRWIAAIAKQERDEVVAEVERRLAGRPFGVWHWAVVDRVYFATAGILQGYWFLERAGWMDEGNKAGEFRPVVATIARLQRLKADALKSLGLDREGDEPSDVLQRLLRQGQTVSPAGAETPGAPEPVALAEDACTAVPDTQEHDGPQMESAEDHLPEDGDGGNRRRLEGRAG